MRTHCVYLPGPDPFCLAECLLVPFLLLLMSEFNSFLNQPHPSRATSACSSSPRWQAQQRVQQHCCVPELTVLYNGWAKPPASCLCLPLSAPISWEYPLHIALCSPCALCGTGLSTYQLPPLGVASSFIRKSLLNANLSWAFHTAATSLCGASYLLHFPL